ncbi:MAG: hypothetical protein OSJ65_01100 [Bacilli bacterium]|nr:hypothetical protein [Bacilli bacterium]
MNDKIKNILQKLEDNGFTAYVVGGFVRDYLLGIETYDVDIATSAEPKDVRSIFDLSNANDDNYGSIYIKDKLYNYDITTYRKELKYVNRRPVEYTYLDTVDEDIERRDFTINSLYMDKSGTVFDKVGGKQDLEDKIIRMIGNINDKMIEDPLRMLRAVRFAATLDFVLESTLKNYIKQNTQMLRTLSYTRKKEELDKIFSSQNRLKGINLLKNLKMDKDLDLEIPDDVVDSINPLGIWAQLKVSGDYSFTKEETDIIDKIKSIISYGIIDNMVLYEYGLYPSIIASDILGLNRKYISDIYKNMPIYSVKDIKINGDEIINILGIEPGSIIKDIILDIELNILNGTLENDFSKIKEYILKNWR